MKNPAKTQLQQPAQKGQPTQPQQAQVPLRVLDISEVVAMALHIYRKRAKEGKTSKRVPIRLRPTLLPPEGGTYETGIGQVRIRSFFKPDLGCWYVEVRLPEDGFKLKDHISQPQQPDSSQ